VTNRQTDAQKDILPRHSPCYAYVSCGKNVVLPSKHIPLQLSGYVFYPQPSIRFRQNSSYFSFTRGQRHRSCAMQCCFISCSTTTHTMQPNKLNQINCNLYDRMRLSQSDSLVLLKHKNGNLSTTDTCIT